MELWGLSAALVREVAWGGRGNSSLPTVVPTPDILKRWEMDPLLLLCQPSSSRTPSLKKPLCAVLWAIVSPSSSLTLTPALKTKQLTTAQGGYLLCISPSRQVPLATQDTLQK